jgi:hypothetical protein
VRFADHVAWVQAPREVLVTAGCLPRGRRASLRRAPEAEGQASVLLVGSPEGAQVLETRGVLAEVCAELRRGEVPVVTASAEARDALSELDALGALRWA